MTEQPKDCDHPLVVVDMDYPASYIKKNILAYIKHPKTICPQCGALIPELKFAYNDRTYTFYLYEVNEYEENKELSLPDMPFRSDTKIVMQTDYEKFRSYLNKRTKK